jgi:hypothetical protein
MVVDLQLDFLLLSRGRSLGCETTSWILGGKRICRLRLLDVGAIPDSGASCWLVPSLDLEYLGTAFDFQVVDLLLAGGGSGRPRSLLALGERLTTSDDWSFGGEDV